MKFKWFVADFEALPYQVTTTFDTSYAARIRTALAINDTACYQLAVFHSVNQFNASFVIFSYQTFSLSHTFANSFERSKKRFTCLGSGM